jgi:hypothetical protein
MNAPEKFSHARKLDLEELDGRKREHRENLIKN